jgi:excisionase family DNA binding protein
MKNDRRSHLRAREIAKLTGLSLRTVRRRIGDGTFRSVKLGGSRLVPMSEIEPAQEAAPWESEESTDE